jgi:hypothetical protein
MSNKNKDNNLPNKPPQSDDSRGVCLPKIQKQISGWVATHWDDIKKEWVVLKFYIKKRDIPKEAIWITKSCMYTIGT